MPSLKEICFATAIAAAAGGVAGAVAQDHTNDVAMGKRITAEATLHFDPTQEVIDSRLNNLLTEGVGGGRPIHSDDLRIGEPVSAINTYIDEQNEEAKSLNPNRVVPWVIAPGAIAFLLGMGARRFPRVTEKMLDLIANE